MKKSLGLDAAKLTISKMITLVISMIVSMLLSRFRSLEEYGTYSQMGLVINLFTAIFMLGLPNSVNFFLAKAETTEEKKKFISTYFELNTLLSVFAGVILYAGMPVIVKYFDNPYIEGFGYFLVIYPWTKIVLGGIDNILIVFNKTNSLFWFRLVNSVLLLLDVVIVQVFSLGFREYMLFLTISETACTILVYVISARLVNGLYFDIDFGYIKKIFAFSLPIGLSSVVGTLCTELDKLFIGKVYNTEQLAIYTNAAKELPVTIIATSISAVVMPEIVRRLNRKENNSAIDLWKNSINLSYCFICLVTTGVFVYAEDVISILYSDKYMAGVEIFRIYTLILLTRCTYFGMLLNAKGKTKFIFYSSIMSLVLNVVLNFTCYYTWGFIGPALASFLSILIVLIFQLLYTAKIFEVGFSYIFPWDNIGVITAVNVGFGVIFYYAKHFCGIDNWIGSEGESVLLGMLWAIFYLIVMYKYIRKQWGMLNRGE